MSHHWAGHERMTNLSHHRSGRRTSCPWHSIAQTNFIALDKDIQSGNKQDWKSSGKSDIQYFPENYVGLEDKTTGQKRRKRKKSIGRCRT